MPWFQSRKVAQVYTEEAPGAYDPLRHGWRDQKVPRMFMDPPQGKSESDSSDNEAGKPLLDEETTEEAKKLEGGSLDKLNGGDKDTKKENASGKSIFLKGEKKHLLSDSEDENEYPEEVPKTSPGTSAGSASGTGSAKASLSAPGPSGLMNEKLKKLSLSEKKVRPERVPMIAPKKEKRAFPASFIISDQKGIDFEKDSY